jgi:hypothetical protein
VTQTPTQTFTSADQSISFTYPAALSVSQKNNVITLHHQIAYSHSDACDFKGTSGTLPNLTDFHVTIQMFNGTVASTAAVVDPSLTTNDKTNNNFAGDVLKLNSGFIDSYNNGVWNGYTVTEGVEGCGRITYYLPVSTSRTLVIQKQLIGELSSVSGMRMTILALPGIISPDQNTTILNAIIQSLSVK